MLKLLKLAIVGAFVMTLAFGTVACVEKKGPMEKAGEKIDDAVDDIGDNIEDAGDEIEDAVDGGGVSH